MFMCERSMQREDSLGIIIIIFIVIYIYIYTYVAVNPHSMSIIG